jgi:hypothetical protein
MLQTVDYRKDASTMKASGFRVSTKQAMRDIPSYRRHKGSGQAVATLNGVDHYLGQFNSPESKVEYNPVVAEWLALGRRLPEASGDPSDIRGRPPAVRGPRVIWRWSGARSDGTGLAAGPVRHR